MTTLFSTLFLWGKIVKFKGDLHNEFYIKLGGIFKVTGDAVTENIEKVIPVILLLAVIIAGSFSAIFLYKNRKLQMKITAGLIGLILILILVLAAYSIYIIKIFDAVFTPGLYLIYPVLMLVFSFLAYRGVKKDDELVKSYDRLR